ncbi:MAG: hypothetical protein KF805_02765 [Phycisphaeraceae bacterium]|nr:hypothetical protein [Phycisphaeraceae bacterium]
MLKRDLGIVVCSLGATLCALPCRAQLIADSFADYSGTQGSGNWYYGYTTYANGTRGPFQQMTLFTSDVWHRAEGGGTSYWTSIWKDGQHPNAKVSTGGRLGEENWVTRRWLAPPGFLAYVHISGRVWKQVTTGGDGSLFHIFVNSGTVLNVFLASNDSDQHTFSADVCVGAGDRIEFVVDPNINDQYDSTNMVATISGPFSQMPVSAAACPGEWATFSMATYANSTFSWQFEYAPNDWRSFTGNAQSLACGGTIRAEAPVNTKTIRIRRTGCAATASVRIRCRLNGPCAVSLSNPVDFRVCAADLNCDGVVDDGDFQLFVGAYDLLLCSDPAMPPNCVADLDGNAMVDDADFVLFIHAYDELVCG